MKKIKSRKRHKAEILIGYLLKGHIIIKNNIRYVLDKDNNLCEERIRTKEIVLLKINFGGFNLRNFIDWANSFTDAEIFLICANKVLNDIK